MSTVDPGTSARIAAAVAATGAAFLEAPVSGSKGPAVDGQLIILAAGDAELYAAALTAFEAMGKKSFLLGEGGWAVWWGVGCSCTLAAVLPWLLLSLRTRMPITCHPTVLLLSACLLPPRLH
jgi:hypothetical protein